MRRTGRRPDLHDLAEQLECHARYAEDTAKSKRRQNYDPSAAEAQARAYRHAAALARASAPSEGRGDLRIGLTVIAQTGDGPLRGRIDSIDGDNVQMQVGDMWWECVSQACLYAGEPAPSDPAPDRVAECTRCLDDGGWTDLHGGWEPCPDCSDRVAEGAFARAVAAEIDRARAKFPGNRHQYVALAEEVGEVAKALIEGESPEAIYAECVQVAAMAQRVAEDGDDDFPGYEPASELRERPGPARRR